MSPGDIEQSLQVLWVGGRDLALLASTEQKLGIQVNIQRCTAQIPRAELSGPNVSSQEIYLSISKEMYLRYAPNTLISALGS
jgi:hypothetical protein